MQHFTKDSLCSHQRATREQKKTADFFVSTRSDRIGKIKYFFQIEISKYAVIDQYVIEKSVDQFLYVQPMSR